MQTSQKSVLLTGFGPFPDVPVNVSDVFADRLAAMARRAFPGVTIVSGTLPTVWREAPVRLEELYFTHRPDVALHFGVSHLAHALTIECCARNHAGRPDALGIGPRDAILTPDGPQERIPTIPTGRIAARLRRRAIPAVLSHDAGNYLCNAILYHSLALMETLHRDGRCGFIHLPTELPYERQPGVARPAPMKLSFEEALAGGLEILTTLLLRPPRLPAVRAGQASSTAA
jgi:pyroglutamyl-peptidase